MDYILYEQNGNVATITINREKALNALNSQVLDELNATSVSYTHLTLPTT